jgi:hypothetical protein
MRVVTPWFVSIVMNFSIGCVECPIVNTVTSCWLAASGNVMFPADSM